MKMTFSTVFSSKDRNIDLNLMVSKTVWGGCGSGGGVVVHYSLHVEVFLGKMLKIK